MNKMVLDSACIAENFELLAFYDAENESKRTYCYYREKNVDSINQRHASDASTTS